MEDRERNQSGIDPHANCRNAITHISAANIAMLPGTKIVNGNLRHAQAQIEEAEKLLNDVRVWIVEQQRAQQAASE